MSRPDEQRAPADAAVGERGILFFDCDHFAAWASTAPLAAFLDAFYTDVVAALEPVGVRVVKFMGDGGLAIFDPSRLQSVVDVLDGLRHRVAERGRVAGLGTGLTAKVHLGEVLTGTFGPGEHARFDVVGSAVNETALLEGRGLVLSATVQARLGT